jgi:hypothetical protein
VAAAEMPDGIERTRHIELLQRNRAVWLRRALMVVVVAVPILALLNLAGQRPSETVVAGPAVALTVRAPERLRGGLLYQTAFTIVGRRHVERLHLVLSPGWFDGLTLNTLEPGPGQEGSRNGRVSLSYGTLDPGQRLVVFADWQVNPTTVGHRDLYAAVYDGGKLLTRLHRTLTVFP